MKHTASHYALHIPKGDKVPPGESKRVLDGSAPKGEPFTTVTDLHHCLSVLGKCRLILESQKLMLQSTVLAEAQVKIMDVLKEIEP